MSKRHSNQDDWLSLLDVSGPFLAVPVLREALPQGLEELDTQRAKRLRSAYEEWRDAVDGDDADRDKLHAAWIDEVLRTALDADDQLLKAGKDVRASVVALPEHDTNIAPEFVFVDPTHGGAVLAVVHVFPPDTDLSASMKFGGLSCSPGDRMVMHVRALNVPFGIVTNGERWMLVHAPIGQVATFASWYARIWGQEPATLRAFGSLLGVRRFFGPEQDRLPALFERSSKHQDEVTDALGDQVRRAIEVLVQALDRADQDRNRELLRDVNPQELYEAGLTVMMRLVFLLAAEERGLLLLGEPRYDSFYAISTLRMQLRAESDEILERRRAAWSRLLAVFRAVFGGIDHPTLRLPAMGGSLFDPDRFPFLEGRLKGTSWRQHRAEPLPVDDRTVLLLLEAIQTFEGRTLSYRALDVEQIGHVYEGLLERTVSRVEDVTLELEAGASAKDARVTLGELESARLDGKAAVANLLVERSKRSQSAIEKELAADVDPQQSARLLSACRGDVTLRDRLEPYVRLLRTDPWGYPLVHPKGAFVVVLGADRRETGTHYTPKSLTERIVEETLTPLVYDGPAKGAPRAAWKLKTPEQLLDLKVCDPAMGSGAFLVQACRFLSARLVEAWAIAEQAGRVVDLTGQVHEPPTNVESMPPGVETRADNARRIVAERCLYGVDLNPLAVELAKLSLWLVTLSKGRPFGFLDHNLRRGDSLLGISRLEQLTELSLDPAAMKQGRLFGKAIERAVAEAVELRRKLHEIPIRDIRDVETMATLDASARVKLGAAALLADAFIGLVLAGKTDRVPETRLAVLSAEADTALEGNISALQQLARRAARDLATASSTGEPRRPFHWPLEFPDVFHRDTAGFDAIVGNPPFLTGKRISTSLGDHYQAYLKATVPRSKGAADLAVFFIRRAFELARHEGLLGMIGTKSIAEGDSRVVGLMWLLANGVTIPWVEHELTWPGSASVTVSLLVLFKGDWRGLVARNGRTVSGIGSDLGVVSTGTVESGVTDEPRVLNENDECRSDGIKIQGDGFIITHDERAALLREDRSNAAVISRYITGMDIAQSPLSEPSAWIINFGTMSRRDAERYRAPFRLLEERVKPYRDSLSGQIHEQDFWKYWDKRERFMESMAGKGRILACPSTSKYLLMTFVDEGWVASHSIKLFSFSDDASLVVMQSIIHEVWARLRSGKLGQTLAYNLTRAFATFPWPRNRPPGASGATLLEQRAAACAARDICLTDLYNWVHSPSEHSSDIWRVRKCHVDIDRATLDAYGWSDITLEHEFREVPYLPENDRMRFTISETARVEILRRLGELNRQRYEAQTGALRPKARGKKAPETAVATAQGALALVRVAESTLEGTNIEFADVGKPAPNRRTRR